MTILKRAAYRGAAALASLTSLAVGTAFADGYATPGQIGFEEAVTPIARQIHQFHDLLMVVITAIVVFVAALLGWVMYRFNEKANPVPSKTTHHTGLEIAWTILPVLILFIIAIPSMRLLTDELVVPKSDITLKVTGKQWFWSYEYPKDQSGGFAFDSYLLKGDDFKPGMLRQLAVDNEAVVPVGKTVHLLVTGADVIHGFVVPSFGVRIDAVPGRMNESWFKCREGRHLLRPVLEDLRQGSCIHADRLQGREREGLYGVARRREEEVRLPTISRILCASPARTKQNNPRSVGDSAARNR